MKAYVVGGYVRDIFLKRPSKDVDFTVIGDGIDFAQAVAKKLGDNSDVHVFKNFGTAMIKTRIGILNLWEPEKNRISQKVENHWYLPVRLKMI